MNILSKLFKKTTQDSWLYSNSVYTQKKINFQVNPFVLLGLIIAILSIIWLFIYEKNQVVRIGNLKAQYLENYQKIINFNDNISKTKNIQVNSFDGEKIFTILALTEKLNLDNYKIEYDNEMNHYYITLNWYPPQVLTSIQKSEIVDIEKTNSTISIIEDGKINLQLIFK